MSSKTKPLEKSSIQLIDGDRGKNYPKESDFFEKEHCLFLSAKNVTATGFEFTQTSFIDKSKDESLRAGKLQRNDIVMTTRGTIGNVAFYGEDIPFDNVRINSGMMIFRANIDEWNPRFLYFLLTSNFIQEQISSLTSGSAVPQLPARDLKKFELPEISIDIQNKIENIVGAIVNKIKLNQQTNQTLEQIAQTLFKSWFVDFEPTRAKVTAKEAGASPEQIERAAMCAISGKTPGQLAQLPPETQQNLKTTAALFPDVLVESELGEMPEGWEVKAMGHYLDTISKTYPLKTVDKVIFLNTGDIQNGQFLHAEYSEASSLPGQAKKSIQKNDILYSEIRPENKRFAFVNFDAPHHVVSTKLMVLRATKDISPLFLYFILTQQSTVDHLQMLAESRSGTFPQITFDHLSRIEFIAPFDNLLINKFVETVLEPSFQTQKMRDAENACLIELRDSLLPKLLSGEIQLKKNEEIINV